VACETTRNPGGIQRDIAPPFISLTNAAGDTQQISGGLQFNVTATDNLGLKSVELFFTGGHVGFNDTVFTSAVTNYAVATTVQFPGGSGAGGLVRIVGRATDGAFNASEDTLFIYLSNIDALQVFLISPAAGAVASNGRGIPIDVSALQNTGIRKIGFLVSPPGAVFNTTTPPSDSMMPAVPYPDSVRYTDTVTVIANSGTFQVVGFAEDSAGRRSFSNVVTVTVLSAFNDTTPPQVDHSISARVEVDDSVRVHATDASGISWIGLRVQRASTGAVMRFDTVNVSGGNLTDVTQNFSLNLGALIPQDSTPFSIIVRGYACDLAARRNCAFSQNSTVIQAGAVIGGTGATAGVVSGASDVSDVMGPPPRRSIPSCRPGRGGRPGARGETC
jgi:hypothetical protein